MSRKKRKHIRRNRERRRVKRLAQAFLAFEVGVLPYLRQAMGLQTGGPTP